MIKEDETRITQRGVWLMGNVITKDVWVERFILAMDGLYKGISKGNKDIYQTQIDLGVKFSGDAYNRKLKKSGAVTCEDFNEFISTYKGR
ncbi:hypothetical protein ACTFR8_24415 [Bacillus cereus group sp. MYBK15-3]|uniref:hypothetical protein n=1 Tax=unclassified Bacillus cereus group TaxID=2750818 RepID=UPI003F7B3064